MAIFNKDKAEKKVPFYKTRKFKYGSASTALTIVFVAVVVIINIIFSLLADTYSWRLDTTSYDLYTLSDQTKQIVESLAKEDTIELMILSAEDEYYPDIKETVKRFANLSDKIELNYVDPNVNPNVLKEYEEYNAVAGCIVMKSNKRIRAISVEELAVQNDNGSIVYKTEEALCTAINYVTQEEVPLVYFLNGRGESGYEALMSLVTQKGADVQEVQLNQLKEFDPSARCVVLCGPTEDYLPSEIRRLQDFLANDYNYERNLMYFTNPGTKELPNLKAFLAEWGIKVNNNLILEDAAHSVSGFDSSDATAPIYMKLDYEGAEVNGVTLSADYEAIVPYSSSIDLLFETDGMTETVALMKTSEGSYAKTGEEISATYEKEEQDQSGPFNVAVLASRYKASNNVPIYSHVFAAGSSLMVNEVIFEYSGNDDFISTVYRMMIGEEDVEIYDAQKQSATPQMTLDDLTVRWTTILFIGIIPGIFLLIGIIVFIRRRYL